MEFEEMVLAWRKAFKSNTTNVDETISLLSRLKKPVGKIDAILDTDTYNEIDDQFALAYMLKSDNKINVKAIYAAPFYNQHSDNPKDGMEKSYNEILNVLKLMEKENLNNIVFKGSNDYLKNETTPENSPAAKHLAELAMEYTTEKPLYVVAIGTITNIASAILINPKIIDRIVVVWLGGNALEWPSNAEFNLMQDVVAARVLLGCEAAVVLLPCMGVVSDFKTNGPELEHWLRGKNKLCDYLVDATTKKAIIDGGKKTWTRAIWDVTAVAWLLDDDFMFDRFEYSPIPEYDHFYSVNKNRHFIRYVYHINRDALFEDLFDKLARD